MHRLFFIIITFFLITSCQGNREQQLEKLDELWGYCDNPHRDFGDLEYDTCKRKERAKTPSGKNKDMEPFNLTGLLTGAAEKQVGIHKMNAILFYGKITDVISSYDLKIADATGGYIRQRIYDKNASQRDVW